jgi:peroxiredoxin family protein
MEEIPMDKISLVLASDEFEKLQAAAMMASVASVSGMEVNVFVTMAAMACFVRERVERKDFLRVGEVGRKVLEKKAPLYVDLLTQGKMMGTMKVFACSLALDLIEKPLSEMVPVFDDVVGVAAFLGIAEGGQVLFV